MDIDLSSFLIVSEEEQPKEKLCEGSKAKAAFGALLNVDQFADVKVICRNVEIPAHKVVLFSRVPFFKEALLHNTIGKNTIEVPQEMSPDAIKLIVKYAYFIEPEVTVHNVQDLLEAAAYFRIEDLWAFCDRFISDRIVVTMENCLAVHGYAIDHFASILTKNVEEFIGRYFTDIIVTDAFRCMSEEEIKSFLNMNDIEFLPDEEMFWEALVKWIEADVKNRNLLMPKLLRLLRLPCLTANVITKEVLPYPYISNDSECRQMVNDLLVYKADPNNAEMKQKCEAAFNMQLRCEKTDHIYYFDISRYIKDRIDIQIVVLQSPDGKWSGKCLKAPEECKALFKEVVAVKHIVYCVSRDNALLFYNCLTETWTLIQGDDGRPDLVRLKLCGVNGKLVALDRFTKQFDCDSGFQLWSYDLSTNSWSQNILRCPDDVSRIICACCGMTSRDCDDDNEMLCLFCDGMSDDSYDNMCMMDSTSSPTSFRVILFDVQKGDLIKCGASISEAICNNMAAVAVYNGKVFIAVERYDDDEDSDDEIGYYARENIAIMIYDVALDDWDWNSLPDLDGSGKRFSLMVANDRLYYITRIPEYGKRCHIKYTDLTGGSSSWQDGPQLLLDAYPECYDGFAVVCRYP